MRDDAATGPSTLASAPKAPGRLGREDARNFGGEALYIHLFPKRLEGRIYFDPARVAVDRGQDVGGFEAVPGDVGDHYLVALPPPGSGQLGQDAYRHASRGLGEDALGAPEEPHPCDDLVLRHP